MQDKDIKNPSSKTAGETSQLNSNIEKLNHNIYEMYNVLQKSESITYWIGFWSAIVVPLISLLFFVIITAITKNISKLKKDSFFKGWVKGTITLLSTIILIGIFILVFFIVFNSVKDTLIKGIVKEMK